MNAEYPAGSKVVPLSYRVHRLAVVAVFLLALLIAGLGAAGSGPAAALGSPARTAVTWVKDQMGLGHPAYQTPVQNPAQPAVVHKHRKHKKHKKKHKHRKHKKGKK